LIAIRVCVTIGPLVPNVRIVLAAARRGAAAVLLPPAVAWSGQRIPTGPYVMQSGQMPRPHSEHDTYVSRSGCL
jgi:hypothetical protein